MICDVRSIILAIAALILVCQSHVPAQEPSWEQQFSAANDLFKKAKYLDAVIVAEKCRLTAENSEGSGCDRVVKSCSLLGMIHHELGRFNEARLQYERCLSLVPESDQEHDKTKFVLYNNLGTLYTDIGRYIDKDANRAFQEATAIAAEQDFPADSKAILLNNLGLLCKAKGEYNKALVGYYGSCSILLTEGGSLITLASNYLNMSLLMAELNQNALAASFVDKAEKLIQQKAPKGHVVFARVQQVRSKLANKEGNVEEAIRLAELAITMSAQSLGESHPFVGSCYATIGDLQVQQGKFEAADKNLKKARSIFLASFGDKPHARVAEVFFVYGDMHKAKGRKKESLDYYQKARRQYLDLQIDESHPAIRALDSKIDALDQRED